MVRCAEIAETVLLGAQAGLGHLVLVLPAIALQRLVKDGVPHPRAHRHLSNRTKGGGEAKT